MSIPFAIIFKDFIKIFIFTIDNSIRCVILCGKMEELNAVQVIIAQLKEKGWSLIAIAESEELKTHRNTVGMWKSGARYPRPDKPVLDALNRLLKRNRIPKRRRYMKSSRREGVSHGQ